MGIGGFPRATCWRADKGMESGEAEALAFLVLPAALLRKQRVPTGAPESREQIERGTW